MNVNIFKQVGIVTSALLLTTTVATASDLFDRSERGSLKDAPVKVERERPSCSASVALTSDYVFRDVSQTDEGPAISGSFDCSYSMFYVGVWASNIDFNIPGGEADIEIDLYGGIKGKVGQFDLDLGVIYYAYPSANDVVINGGAESDFVEVKFAVSTELTKSIGISGAVNWTDDYFGESGEAVAVEGGISIGLGNWQIIKPTFTGAIGYQDFDNAALTSYTYWNAGIEFAMPGFDKFTIDLRYHDTDLDNTDTADSRFVGTVSSSW